MKDENAVAVVGEVMDIAHRPEPLHPAAGPVDILTILDRAVQMGAGIETLERLVALKERTDAAQARREFFEAKAAFKRDCPPIVRKSVNTFFKKPNRDGVDVPTKYANEEDVAAPIAGTLADNGLSYEWNIAVETSSEETTLLNGSKTMVEKSTMMVTCVLSHVGGHKESSSFPVPVESNAGCSPAQKYGIAQAYGKRYSLINVLGLTSVGDDEDGNEPSTPITAEQVATLEAAMTAVKADAGRFLKMLGVGSLAELPSAKYADAVAALERKGKASK